MKKIIIFLLSLSYSASAQLGLTDNYQFNLLANNPAFTGERGNFGVSGLLGQQFNGTVTPNQISQIISMDGKLNNERNAIGFQGFRSAITGFINNGMSLTYSYEIPTQSNVRLKLGLNAGFLVAPNFVSNSETFQRFKPFFGPGFSALFPSGFLGIAAPSFFGKTDLYTTVDKNIKLMAGYRFGTYENVALNLSVLSSVATRPEDQAAFHTNAKIWFGNKVGLGASLRVQGKRKKAIPTFELRVSESSTIGISYDSAPLRFLETNAPLYNPNGIFQLLYRYDVFNEGEKSPLLNQF